MSVYFARRGRLIKIGHSRNVPDRMMHLGAKLIGAVPGDRKMEIELHKRFAHLRVRGEWFRPNEELLAFIRNDAQSHEPDAEVAQMTIRLPDSLLARAENIGKRMSQPGLELNRADILRMAACRGIEILEKRGTKHK